MNLKAELEVLRGESIEVYSTKPEDVPYIETSNPELLCKNPVVSVHMITYNHEPYIRQAIEGVMMQKTDFEFELIIGEDCSQDKTREICFEYQKKYPDKIRVLWWHENVSKFGGNGQRVSARCRGEFIAFCEGDDYWIDPYKLQKQVKIFRENSSVGICFAQARRLYMASGKYDLWTGEEFPEGFMNGRKFFTWLGFGKSKVAKKPGPESFIMTASVMILHEVMLKAKQNYEIFTWRLLIGDSTLWLGCSALSDVYFLKEPLSVYRIHSAGAMHTGAARITRDGLLVRMYFAVKVFGFSLDQVVDHMRNLYANSVFAWAIELPKFERIKYLEGLKASPHWKVMFGSFRTLPARVFMKMGWLTPFTRLWGCRFLQRLPMANNKTDPFEKVYQW